MPETETKEKVSSTVKTTNCANCNKSLKRVKWYYRNGKYYCNKKCWKAFQKKG
ncbi:MAG: hypothetical protein HY761_09605 [Candidatus Omnitrophica bacterium]|nr:hypothetical protein [Candidatus Omnitrophota bacterium]